MKKQIFNRKTFIRFLGVLLLLTITIPLFDIYSEHFYKGEEEIVLLDKEYKTLNEILKHPDFNNKVIFVDVWGTSCGPCIKQFAYKDSLEAHFAGKPITFLYLAYKYNKANDIRRWKSMIRKYNLKGYHFFMNWDFYYDLEDTIDEDVDKTLAIPRYFIVGMDKEIVYADAYRPKTGMQLYNQIELVLQKNKH